jgi:hypothetical protein
LMFLVVSLAFLFLTLTSFLQHKCLGGAELQAMASHLIEVGSLTRQLPVREVKPGVFVALFNPLGGVPHAPGRPPDRNSAPAQ